MQVNFAPALFAEISLCQDSLATSKSGQAGSSPAAAAPLLRQDSPGFVSLADICHQIRRSRSWVYEQGIVPLTDADGNPIDGGKNPPFPWLTLPPPCINLGKKLWAKKDIDNWMLSIRARAIRSNEYARSTSEVMA